MADFGKTAIGTSNANGAADRLRVSKFVAPADVGTSVSISAYLDRTVAGSQSGFTVKGVIYADSAGKPGALVGSVEITGGLGVVLNSPAWYTGSLAVALTPGTTYWLGIHQAKTVQSYYDSGVAGDAYRIDSTYATGPPNPWSGTTETGETRVYSVYVTYTPLKRGLISFAELETPAPARRGRVSFAEMETPDTNRRGFISQAEMEVPNTGTVAFALRDAGIAALRDGYALRESGPQAVFFRGRISYAEFEVPSETIPRRGRISFVEMQVPDVTPVSDTPGVARGYVRRRNRAKGSVTT